MSNSLAVPPVYLSLISTAPKALFIIRENSLLPTFTSTIPVSLLLSLSLCLGFAQFSLIFPATFSFQSSQSCAQRTRKMAAGSFSRASIGVWAFFAVVVCIAFPAVVQAQSSALAPAPAPASDGIAILSSLLALCFPFFELVFVILFI